MNKKVQLNMKKILTALTLAATTLVGCTIGLISEHEDSEEVVNNGKLGSVCLSISKNDATQTKASDDEVLDALNITIIYSETGVEALNCTVAEFNENHSNGTLSLYPGYYNVSVSSVKQSNAAWDQPIFYCTKDFTISSETVTNITLVATVQNMKVSVIPDAAFKAEFSEYTIVVSGTFDDGYASLSWTPEVVAAGNSGWFGVAPLYVNITAVRNQSGTVATSSLEITDVAAADHHIISLSTATTGDATFVGISLDYTLNGKTVDITLPGLDEMEVLDEEPSEDVEDGDDEDGEDDEPSDEPSDEPEDDDDSDKKDEGDDEGSKAVEPEAAAISIVWESNPDFEEVYIEDGMDVELLIKAENGIETFLVDIESESLAFALELLGLSTTLDPINDEGSIDLLSGLGVPTGDELYGQTEVTFPLSDLIPLITMLSPDAGSKHYFNIKITDSKDNSIEQLLTFVMPEE